MVHCFFIYLIHLFFILYFLFYRILFSSNCRLFDLYHFILLHLTHNPHHILSNYELIILFFILHLKKFTNVMLVGQLIGYLVVKENLNFFVNLNFIFILQSNHLSIFNQIIMKLHVKFFHYFRLFIVNKKVLFLYLIYYARTILTNF